MRAGCDGNNNIEGLGGETVRMVYGVEDEREGGTRLCDEGAAADGRDEG